MSVNLYNLCNPCIRDTFSARQFKFKVYTFRGVNSCKGLYLIKLQWKGKKTEGKSGIIVFEDDVLGLFFISEDTRLFRNLWY